MNMDLFRGNVDDPVLGDEMLSVKPSFFAQVLLGA